MKHSLTVGRVRWEGKLWLENLKRGVALGDYRKALINAVETTFSDSALDDSLGDILASGLDIWAVMNSLRAFDGLRQYLPLKICNAVSLNVPELTTKECSKNEREFSFSLNFRSHDDLIIICGVTTGIYQNLDNYFGKKIFRF